MHNRRLWQSWLIWATGLFNNHLIQAQCAFGNVLNCQKKQNTQTIFSETILQFECHLMREIDLGRLELLNELSDVDKSD